MVQKFGIPSMVGAILLTGALGTAACSPEAADEGEAAAMQAGEGSDNAAAETPEMSSPHGQVSVVMYECADEKSFALTVAQGVGQAALRFEEGVFQLEQQEVASGMAYSDGTYTVRGQGPEASVEKDGEPLFTDCVATGHPATTAN